MKKILFILFTTGISLIADDWPFVCERQELPFLWDKRYFGVGANTKFPFVGVDTNSINIDRKNKIIKVWTIWLASQTGRQDQTDKYHDYSNFGYKQNMYVIDYEKMRSLPETDVFYNCDGGSITSFNYDDIRHWNNIVPNSTMEQISKSIMKKYNLK